MIEEIRENAVDTVTNANTEKVEEVSKMAQNGANTGTKPNVCHYKKSTSIGSPASHLEYISIEEIGLSVRSHNALRRAKVHNVNELLKLQREQLLMIKNLGAKSINEIEAKQLEIKGDPVRFEEVIPNNVEIPYFIDRAGVSRKDIPISDIGLSFRSERLLTERGYKYASELLDISAEQLLIETSMGSKSANEILVQVSSIIFDEIDSFGDIKMIADKNCMDFVSSLLKHILVNHRELYKILLPYFKVAHENGTSIDKDAVFSEPIICKGVLNAIIAALKKKPFGMHINEIHELLPNSLFPDNAINVILDEMSADGIVRTGHVIELIVPNLREYVDSIAEDRQRIALGLRLQGKTLEEIGNEISVSRERVRQIISKGIRTKNAKQIAIEEDKYSEIYRTYSFSKESFSLAFGTDDSVFIYLSLVNKKPGNLPIEQFIEDASYPLELRKGAERVVYGNYFNIGGLKVLKQRSELADYVCRTYFQEEATFDDFLITYNSLLLNLGVSDDNEFIINDRTYQSRLSNSNIILWKYPSRFRYYDMAEYDFTDLLRELDLEQYKNIEYSTLKFFRSYPGLMEQYDIHDEYELHNLLKKLYNKIDNTYCSFSRMPMIEFGEVDRENQVLDLLTHLAPIDVQGFCDAYEAEYGVLSRTVAGGYISSIDKYKNSNGIFDLTIGTPSSKKRLEHNINGVYIDISTDSQMKARTIFTAKFPNGYRHSSNIDFERFKNYYTARYGDEFPFKSDSLNTYFASIAVIHDDRMYLLDDGVVDSVRLLLEQQGFPCISIDVFFEMHSSDLLTLGIFSKGIFKAFIEKKYVDISCRYDYIYLQTDVTLSEIIRSVFDEKEIWSLSDLYARLPLLKPDTIRQILNRDEYFRIETGVYVHLDHMDLPDSEGELIIDYVNNSLKNKDFVTAIELDLSQFERLNHNYPFSVISDAVFRKFLSDRFSKSGQVITHKGKKLYVLDILMSYCREVETVTLSELNAYEAMFSPSGRTHSQGLEAALSVLTRVSEDLFVKDEKLDFSIEKTDEAISLFCRGDFIPLKEITDLTLFPDAGFSWNLFLLESYVRKFSRIFKFDVRSANSSNIGVIVRKTFGYNYYNDIMAIAIANSYLSLDDRWEAATYLFDNGYIGMRRLGKGEGKIWDKAKLLREGGTA